MFAKLCNVPAFLVWGSWLCGGTTFVPTHGIKNAFVMMRFLSAFVSILDVQDVFNCLYSKQLRRTGIQDENQQGVQARHT